MGRNCGSAFISASTWWPLIRGRLKSRKTRSGRGAFSYLPSRLKNANALSSECADRLASGEAEIGILPVVEMARQKLDFFRGSGIASFGPVRSILLISKVPFGEIRTLATDSGSRTSVMLARVILAEKFG